MGGYNMNKLKKWMVGSLLSLSLFTINTHADAATNYQVKSGDTFWKIASRFGVTVYTLKNANNRTSNMLYAGEAITIPSSTISFADKDLMARLVSAEAKGEPYAGKVAVATVILNRMDHVSFPNTVKGVIYQVDSGYYAFTPVKNGAINNPADAASKQAVNEALALRGTGKGSLYFYNPTTAQSSWILTKTVTTRIGNHVFAK
jgi:N-acetylmuramoyl-L-alanine amidase